MSKDGLAPKIINFLESRSPCMASTWDIANALYNGTMNTSKPRNGAIISNIVRAANRHDCLIHHDGNIHLKKSR
jgi:hypothetical protein